MSEWKKASCTLCSVMCGLEIQVENNKIVRVRPDPDNPRSENYCCRKGRNIRCLQHNPDRILYPMKRVAEGKFERISWEQAIKEIAERLKKGLAEHGPKTLAYQGMGGFTGQMHVVSGKHFMTTCGTQYHFNARAAELTGFYQSCGVMFGMQNYMVHPDEDRSEVLVISGWNPYVGHNTVQARRMLHHFSDDPNKVLIVIDPRRSETAGLADYHLPIRPGTDAVLWRGMTALLLQEGWENKEYIKEHVSDLEKILPWFEGVDPREYIEFCGLDYDEVREITHMLATRRSSIHSDLGVICGRHSTVTTHIQDIFFTLCGHMLVPGGMTFNPMLMQGASSDIDDPAHWRLNLTKIPKIFGIYPTACLAEEIDNDTPDHIRMLFAVNSNPMRSIVNTKAMEKALRTLDLLVTIDCQFGETCMLSDYVLPTATGFEVWEYFSIAKTFPGQYHQIREPIIKPEGEIKELPEIWLMLYKEMGFFPEDVPQSLYDAADAAAKGGRAQRMEYGRQLDQWLKDNPQYAKKRIQIVSDTLGRAWGPGAMGKALYWHLLHTAAPLFRQQCARKGYAEGPEQMEQVFEDSLAHPEGFFPAEVDMNNLFDLVQTPDKKIHLYFKELEGWIQEINPQDEEKALYDPEYPWILHAGWHIDTQINQTMRDPAFYRGHEDPNKITIHPDDGAKLGVKPGDLVRVATRIGQVELPVRFARNVRRGVVYISHGHGYYMQGKMYGFNVNFLTDDKNRDRFAGTPFHRYEHCKVEAVSK